MLRPRDLRTPVPRRGVILLVVLLLLTLFAVVGLTFVLYADAEARSARLAREAESRNRPGAEPELMGSYFLGQLLFDVKDDESGVYSALRGHSLARTMYGFDDEGRNDIPFNGTGRLHTGAGTYMNPFDIDDYRLINYTCFPGDRFLRDPERSSSRAGPGGPRGLYIGGFNAPYTYPDLNNVFLAAVKADGTVLMPSFHRPWLFGTNDPTNNLNWTNQEGKYLLLRPRPADMGPGFPYPEDAGGDVKNLAGGPGGNDSYWLDLGAPVLTAPDGRKFKPLFAPLVLDLDSRINLNVHGNARGADWGHVSNQGWGPWEVNPRRLSDPNDAARQQEWANLFTGSARPPWPGRYGGTPWAGRFGTPGPAGASAPPALTPHFYAPVDYDGCQEQAGYISSARLRLPGTGAPPLSCFPAAAAGYGNGSAGERAGHPRLHNAFRPAGDDRALGPWNLEALLRHGDTGSPALTSELLRLSPQVFADPRVRRLVTTHSFDVDRPGVMPWLGKGRGPYRLEEKGLQPSGEAIVLPPPVSAWVFDGEFAPTGRAPAAKLGRLDVNRLLPAFPTPDAVTGRIADLAGFRAAQAARQQLAEDLLLRLRAVTGASDPAAAGVQPPEFAALRWLAQLAVNIVDFIDADDYLTPFPWHTARDGTRHWVFGTELPRVVINEVYAEYGGEEPLSFYVWVELLNPFFRDDTLTDSGTARLAMPAASDRPAYGIYQVVLTRTDELLRRPENVRGDPDEGAVYAFPPLDFTDLAPGAPDRIEPADGNPSGPEGGNRGFYVIGPRQKPFPGDGLRLSHESTKLVYQDDVLERPAILLRRLACPHLPPNDNPSAPSYNPYVTVDYREDVRLNNGTSPPAMRSSQGRVQPYAAHRSQQVSQPWAGGDNPGHTLFRHNTDGTQPAQRPFDWLVHLDRPLVSPMELLHVSGFKPHELTQQFMTDAGQFQHLAPWFDQGVPAGWSVRLYRAFEFLATRSRAAGLEPISIGASGAVSPGLDRAVTPARMSGTTPSGAPWSIRPGEVLVIDRGGPNEENVRVKEVLPPEGPVQFTADFLQPHGPVFTVTLTALGDRIPGKVNLNTVWDPEVLLALCDPQPANSFTPADVDAIFMSLMTARTPDARPGRNDRPFWGLAAGSYPAEDRLLPDGDVEDTFFRSGPGGRRLFQVPGVAHPHPQYELMTKVFNHVTMRSNVFAVWLTVGFFAVVDDTTRPVQLGAEIGRAENRHVRHRLFAIVDRSVLSFNPGPQPRFNPRDAGPLVPYFSIID